MATATAEEMAAALPLVAREIEQFANSAGWDQPAQMFALVPTAQLLHAEPNLAEQLDPASTLTPIAQDELPSQDLAEALAQVTWPDEVAGCALVQEILILPPEAEAELPDDANAARTAAAEHPHRHEARLVAAAMRNGDETCVMRLRASSAQDKDETEQQPGSDAATSEIDEIVQDTSLAPNLLRALHETFQA